MGWGVIGWRDLLLEVGALLEALGKPEATQLDLLVVEIVEPDRSGVDVPVHYLLLVGEPKRLQQLRKDLDGLKLGEVSVFSQLIEEKTALWHFLHNVEPVVVFEDLDRLLDVRVIERNEQLQFFANGLDPLRTQLLLLEDLRQPLLARCSVHHQSDLTLL